MIYDNKIIKIYGGAGTGKTTYLINILDKLKKSEDLRNIGFFSFSKDAINVVKKRLKIDNKELPYFSTLHSLAWKGVGMTKEQLYLPTFSYTNEKIFKEVNFWENLNALYQYQKCTFCTWEQLFENTKTNISKKVYDAYLTKIKKYLDDNKKLDFTDIIKKYISNNIFPKFEYLFIDESQDLTPILWELVKKLVANTKKTIFLAGDDDQAIYSFTGAKSLDFIDFKENERIILPNNYRNPKNVFKLAESQLLPIVNRIPKEIEAVKNDSLIFKNHSIYNIDKNLFGTIGILFRYYNDAIYYEKYLQSLGKAFFTVDNQLSSKKYKSKRLFDIYPNIYVSTWHRSKGKEYDNVYVFMQKHDNHTKMTDDERRVTYVAMTRTRGNLYLCYN